MNLLSENLTPKSPEYLASYISAIPDFPRPGILFRDIMPLVAEPPAFRELISRMAREVREAGSTKVLGLESRGFIFGAAIAHELGLPFVTARKPGKLPGPTVSLSYALEYGEQQLEMQRGSTIPGDSVAIIDDLLATGGTAKAAAALVRQLGAEVSGHFFAIELDGLGGRNKIAPDTVSSVLHFE